MESLFLSFDPQNIGDLTDFTSVQLGPIAVGIAIVLGQGAGKIVSAGKILLGTHIYIVVVHVV